jgi:hypothetical protein
MNLTVRHLHTYFLFPFSVDKEAVLEDDPRFWPKHKTWFDGLDQWINHHTRTDRPALSEKIGPWQRASYTSFDLEADAYQTMVFFHPFVRRVFFDAHDPKTGSGREESLLNCYEINLRNKRVMLRATDARGRNAEVQITDLRLFLFANGIGILSIGVEAFDIPVQQALWINEMVRKVYPSSGRQIREGRVPDSLCILVRGDAGDDVVLEESFRIGGLINFHPRLANTITGLLYFADYSKHEYSAVLDDRMLVYTYLALDSTSAAPDYIDSEEFQVLLSRALYVDRYGDDYRYQRAFTRRAMRRQMYRRWAHQGTYYGSTSYSNITVCSGVFDCDEHSLREGFLIHRMFDTRYYLMCIVSTFYRAALLDFSERAALVSKRLYLDQADAKLTPESIHIVNRLRADFLHFTNYWLFDELANKDEEMEHFLLQCRAYRLGTMKAQTEEEIEKLNAYLNEYYANQGAIAVNRLAVSTMVLGAGAVITGYFGMNFAREFGRYIFEPGGGTSSFLHYLLIILVTVFAIGSLAFSFALMAVNWRDYRSIIVRSKRLYEPELQSLRRGSLAPPPRPRRRWPGAVARSRMRPEQAIE